MDSVEADRGESARSEAQVVTFGALSPANAAFVARLQRDSEARSEVIMVAHELIELGWKAYRKKMRPEREDDERKMIRANQACHVLRDALRHPGDIQL